VSGKVEMQNVTFNYFIPDGMILLLCIAYCIVSHYACMFYIPIRIRQKICDDDAERRLEMSPCIYLKSIRILGMPRVVTVVEESAYIIHDVE